MMKSKAPTTVSRGTKKSRASRSEAGASLILALAYIVAISLVVGALASWVMNDLNNTVHFQSASARDYAATAATDVAIADIRYNPYESSTIPGPGNCFSPPTGANTSGLWTSNGSTLGYTMAVWCSTTQTLLAPHYTREVIFYTCDESTLELSNPLVAALNCQANPLLKAEVGYDDNPGDEAFLTSTCTDTCGESATVQEWIWGGSNGSGGSSTTPGAPSKVVFTTEPPATTTIGATLASFTVSVEDASGNVETTGNTGATDSIVLTVSSGCTLGGTDTATAADGVATFSAVTITAGTSCTLTATDATRSLTTATSTPATAVTSGTPNKVVFSVEPPATTTAGATLASFAVSVEDANGHVVTTGTGATDSIALTSTCTLGGTDTVTAANGVATFSAVTIAKGTSCTLTATDSSRTLTTATSSPATTVTPAAPYQLVFTPAPPTTANSGSALTSFAVSVEDTYGNMETTGNTGATDSIGLGASAGCTLGGTISITATSGVATFSNTTITTQTRRGVACTVTVTDSTRTLSGPALTATVTVSGG
jgi:hypothetical protein